MNANDLIAFEDEVASLFNSAKIKAPVHLYSNNEDHMIKIFQDVASMIGYFVHGDRITSAC